MTNRICMLQKLIWKKLKSALTIFLPNTSRQNTIFPLPPTKNLATQWLTTKPFKKVQIPSYLKKKLFHQIQWFLSWATYKFQLENLHADNARELHTACNRNVSVTVARSRYSWVLGTHAQRRRQDPVQWVWPMDALLPETLVLQPLISCCI